MRMIQRLLAERPVQALDLRGRIGRAVGDRDALDAHDVREPEVQVAPVAPLPLSSPFAVTELAKYPIVVVQ